MQVHTYTDESTVARESARWIAARARESVSARGQFLFAVSGGKTPWLMLDQLALESDVPWAAIHIFQIDERVAPPASPERNLTHLENCLLDRTPLPQANIHAMPVNNADLNAAATEYAAVLHRWAGTPPVLDVAHLGLGADGHTASLVPGDGALHVEDADVAITGEYQGRQRMTLTYPVLNAARHILWLATGESKREMLKRLLAVDRSIPAGAVAQQQAVLMTDQTLSAG